MRRASLTWLGVGLAAFAVFVSAPSAQAADRGGERIVFRLRGSNGYKLYVIGQGATGGLVVTRGRHRSGASASIYIAHAKTGPRSLAVRFGGLGLLDVRFRPSGRVTYGKRRRHCHGPDRYTTHYGSFVGTIRFKGENAYTAVRSHRVKGKVVTPAVLRCASFIDGRRATIWNSLMSPASTILTGRSLSEASAGIDLRSSPRLPHLLGGHGRRTELLADWKLGVAAQAFGAIERGRRRPVFFAGTLESRERLAVVRLAVAIGTPADLLASDSLSTATVSPPSPFSGEGTFRHFDDGTKSWTGSLAVSLPGAPSVPLTGAPFKVGLSRGF